jgi:hypothetical protein
MSTASARWRVHNRHGWFPCLGHQKCNPSKNRERDGVLALGGRRSDVKRNSQPKVGVSGEGIMIEETRSRQNVWGTLYKKNKIKIHRCLWTAANQQRLTQQPTKSMRPRRRGVWRGCAPVGRHGGEARYHCFGGVRSGEANKNKNKSLSLVINFFLGHTIKKY